MLLFTYKCFKFIFRYLIPGRLRYPIVRAMARGVCFVNARRRSVLVKNLTPLVGAEKAVELAPQLLGNFLMTAVDFFCAQSQKTRVVLEGWSHVEEAYRESRRVIIVTAHLGNWEIGISCLTDHGHDVACIYATYTDDAIVQWIMSHRNPEVEWIPAEPGAADTCVAAVEKGRILAIAADIPYGEHGRRVTIAGHHARLPLGPWSIALRAKATVIPAFILRTSPGRYHAVIHEPIKPSSGSLKQQMITLQETYRGHLEHYLKTFPEQWGNLAPFWDS